MNLIKVMIHQYVSFYDQSTIHFYKKLNMQKHFVIL